jgi:arginine-tRNA-protein transferase
VTSLTELKFYVTPAHPCSYLDDRDAVTLFVDPAAQLDQQTYSALSASGFRRSGIHVYRPHCQGCAACIPLRIPVQDFQLTKSQRRIWRRNRDLRVSQVSPGFTRESYQLYHRYVSDRHADGDMYPPREDQFRSFLVECRSETVFYELRLSDRLIAVAVVDQLRDGLSSVYTYFDTEDSRRSPGVYAILWQIEQARQLGLHYLYLGYWIKQSRKMSYKISFRPIELYMKDHWVRLN